MNSKLTGEGDDEEDVKNVWTSDKSWEPEKIWKFEHFKKFENLKIRNLKFKMA